ncbi:hypothetical protein [Burkholderia sp. AU28863]|uniref:hypothetical protein n=1 Tax=Burkholderia sp. AU28863 TaxID=2015352 RepID=UPI0015C5AE05|nr:hypothetical protein [Burkholderia sp. AU28863]
MSVAAYDGRMDATPPSPAFPPAPTRVVATVGIGFVVTQLDATIVNIARAFRRRP